MEGKGGVGGPEVLLSLLLPASQAWLLGLSGERVCRSWATGEWTRELFWRGDWKSGGGGRRDGHSQGPCV